MNTSVCETPRSRATPREWDQNRRRGQGRARGGVCVSAGDVDGPVTGFVGGAGRLRPEETLRTAQRRVSERQQAGECRSETCAGVRRARPAAQDPREQPAAAAGPV